jgi:hypothetical protein
MNPFRVRFFNDYSGAVHIVITKHEGNKVYAAKEVNLVFEELPEGSFFKEPTLRINWYHSKDLMAALKEALDGEKLPLSSVEGELKATKVHLEDMRKLVFDETFPISNIEVKK